MTEYSQKIRINRVAEPKIRIKVKPRVPPLDPEFRNTGTDIEVRVGATGEWETLVPLADITGPDGEDGQIVEIVAGAGITVDNTNPANPVVTVDAVAAEIPFAPAGAITATDTQSAIEELDGRRGFNTVAALLADTAVLGYSGATVNVTTGDVIKGGGFRYEVAASGASDEHLTTAGGVKLYVLPGDTGRANLEAFGAIGDDSTDNDAAVAVAISSGLKLTAPSGVFRVSGAVALAEGTDIDGVGTIYQTTDNVALFTATDLDWFHIHGVTLKGSATSDGSGSAFGAVTVVRCADFRIEDCHFDTWPAGGGVWMIGSSAAITGGTIQNNTFTKGSVAGTTTGYGVQDNSAVQVYEYCRNVRVLNNRISGAWYCALLFQDRVNRGGSAITGLLVEGNRAEGMSNYGMVCYTLAPTITNIADNGAGLFRVTCAGHGYVTGDRVSLDDCGAANGVWTVTRIDDDNIDLGDSVYAAASNGNLRNSLNCSGRFANNHMEDIDGSRDTGASTFPYGSGFYLQAVGGLTCIGNTFRKTNLLTNSETLTPGAIGVNGLSGDIQISGGWISEAGYQGIVCKAQLNGQRNAHMLISDITITDTAEEDIFVDSMVNLSMRNISIQKNHGAGVSTSRVYFANTVNLSVDGLFWPNCYGVQRALIFSNCTGFIVRGCNIKNIASSSVTCELVYFSGCADGVIVGNNFDGDQSAFPALTLDGVTNTMVSGNRIKMTPDGSARAVVSLKGTSTGTLFGLDNHTQGGRWENTSTGGMMITRDTTAGSGGKTRQIGDAILHTDPTTGTLGWWHKVAVSSGASDWESAAIS